VATTRICRWIQWTLPIRRGWCIINHRLWVLLVTWPRVRLLAQTTIFTVHLVQVRTRIKGRTAGWQGCLWEVSRRKAKKEIIIIIIRILRYWIISSRTARTVARRTIRTPEAVKATVTNLNSGADSLTTQTSPATPPRTCKSAAQATSQVTNSNKCTWPLTNLQVQPITWMRQPWAVMRTTCRSWRWVQWRVQEVSSRCQVGGRDRLFKTIRIYNKSRGRAKTAVHLAWLGEVSWQIRDQATVMAMEPKVSTWRGLADPIKVLTGRTIKATILSTDKRIVS